jgi:hypothetical protein
VCLRVHQAQEGDRHASAENTLSWATYPVLEVPSIQRLQITKASWYFRLDFDGQACELVPGTDSVCGAHALRACIVLRGSKACDPAISSLVEKSLR